MVKGSRISLSGNYEYEGDFKDNAFHGQGSLKHPDGSRYEGQFKEGKKHGEGIFWPKDGGRWKVTYEEGKRTNSEQLDVMSDRTKVIIGCVIFVLFIIIFDDIF